MAENNILSIKKAFDIMDILLFEDINGKGMTLTELSARLGQRTTTMHNILKTMVNCGYVTKIDTGLYAAGYKCRETNDLNRILPGSTLYRKIEEIMEDLAQKHIEGLVLAAFLNGTRVPIMRADSKGVISIDPDVFENKNIYATSTGRVLAAYTNESVRDLHDGVWDEVNSDSTLKIKLDEIRQNGFCKSMLLDNHIIAMAVPVKIQPLCALGCYTVMFNNNEEREEEIMKLLLDAAEKIRLLAN